MPRGGARPGSGLKKGTRLRPRLSLKEGELDEVRRISHSNPGARLLKDQLAEYATLVALLAAQYQPPKGPDNRPLKDKDTGEMIWSQHSFERFTALMQLHGYLAGKGAPFQSPTFKAIHLAIDEPKHIGDQAKVINLRIFEDTGTALGLMEAIDGQAEFTEMDGGRSGDDNDDG